MTDIKVIWKELARLKVFGNNKAIKDSIKIKKIKANQRLRGCLGIYSDGGKAGAIS